MILFGSIVHRNLVTLSMLEPAAPSAGTPAARHGRADFVGFAPGQRAFARSEIELAAARRMSTLLTRQTTELFWGPHRSQCPAIGASSPSYTFRATLGGCNRLRCPRR